MKKLNSKLFKSLKLTKNELQKCNGGIYYTSTDIDSNAPGGKYDVLFRTYDSNGNYVGIDSNQTGPGSTLDAPLP